MVTLSNVVSSVTVPDGKMDCMIENESTADEEEQSAACHAMAKEKVKKTVKQQVDPKATEKSTKQLIGKMAQN